MKDPDAPIGTYELSLLDGPLQKAKEQTHSAMGQFALATVEASIAHLQHQPRLTATELARFLGSVEKCMRAVLRADKELREDVLGDLEAKSNTRDKVRSDFGAIEGRRLQ